VSPEKNFSRRQGIAAHPNYVEKMGGCGFSVPLKESAGVKKVNQGRQLLRSQEKEEVNSWKMSFAKPRTAGGIKATLQTYRQGSASNQKKHNRIDAPGTGIEIKANAAGKMYAKKRTKEEEKVQF